MYTHRFRPSENYPISTGLQPWILTVLVGRTAREDRNRQMNRPRDHLQFCSDKLLI